MEVKTGFFFNTSNTHHNLSSFAFRIYTDIILADDFCDAHSWLCEFSFCYLWSVFLFEIDFAYYLLIKWSTLECLENVILKKKG